MAQQGANQGSAAAGAANPAANGPLSGVKIVDLTALVFGPYATQMMADMGADIVKVEPPALDNTRFITQGPVPKMGGVFANINRGKKGVVLDLRSEDGKAKLRTLIADADVFIHSMRGSAIARLGFDYEAVKAIRPDIIYVNCYGYSRRGPLGARPAYDDTIQAECGICHTQELMDGRPGFAATIMADKVAGLHAFHATLAALYHRERTGGRGAGEGQELEVTMFEAMASFMLVEHANGAMFSPPTTPANYHRAVEKNRRPYKTRDGYIAALVYNDKHWNAFMDAIRPAWNRPEYATLEERAKRIGEVYGHLGETFRERTTDEWIEVLNALQIPCARLQTTDELFENEHLQAIDFFETVDTAWGPTRFPGPPLWFSRTPSHVAGPPPLPGEHNEAVFGSGDVADAAPADALATSDGTASSK